jgi:hypothetical protein
MEIHLAPPVALMLLALLVRLLSKRNSRGGDRD